MAVKRKVHFKKHNTGTGATVRDWQRQEVLFQKLYDKWYAFSVVDDDCLMTEVSDKEINKRFKKTVLKTS